MRYLLESNSKINKVLLLWLLLVPLFGLAQDFPERPNPPRIVNDFAQMLSVQERQALESKLVAFNDTSSTQIAIVTVTSIGDYEVADYSTQLAEKWGIGQKGKNNGVLVFVSLKERKMNIAVGYGLEGVIPDAYAKQIIEQEMRPAFKQNQFYAGLDRATDRLMQLAAGEYTADRKQGAPAGAAGGSLLVLFFFILVIFMFLRRSRKVQRSHFGSSPLGTLASLILMSKMGGGGRYDDFNRGGGIFGGGGGDGGGFGGFGGGSFGGGGASGDW